MDMVKVHWFVGLALLTAAASRPGAAQEPEIPAAVENAAAADPVLGTLVQEAMGKNPDLLALQEAVLAARARPDQARALADPMLSVAYTNDGWAPSLGSLPMTTLAFMGSQQLPWPGKRGLRGELAARDADAVEQQLERARLGTAAAVTRAYYGLVLSRELMELVREQEALWTQIEGVARARYAVGQGAQPDVLRVQIEVTRVEEQRALLEAESRIRLAELNRLTGRPAGSPLETKARLLLRPSTEQLEPLLERLSTSVPELRTAALAEESARLRVALAAKEWKPDFGLQAGYMNRGGLDPMWQAGVSVSLPVQRGKRAAGAAEADAQARASARLRESVLLQLRYRTEERLAQLQATERIAALYAQGIIPQGRMAVDAAVANYQSGRVPFVAVLETLTTLYGDRAAHLGLLANLQKIRASLEEASLDQTTSLAGGVATMAERSVPGFGATPAAGAGAAIGSGRSMP
jgi:outer membrane protein TolC